MSIKHPKQGVLVYIPLVEQPTSCEHESKKSSLIVRLGELVCNDHHERSGEFVKTTIFTSHSVLIKQQDKVRINLVYT